MKKIIYLITLILLVSFTMAIPDQIFKKETTSVISQPCYNSDNSQCTNETECRVTFKDPDGNLILNNELSTYSLGGFYNNTVGGGNLTQTGNYEGIRYCNSSTENGNDLYTIEVNFTGSPRENILPLAAAISFFAILFIAIGLLLYMWRGEDND